MEEYQRLHLVVGTFEPRSLRNGNNLVSSRACARHTKPRWPPFDMFLRTQHTHVKVLYCKELRPAKISSPNLSPLSPCST